eukprot:g26223.t1
MVAFLRHTLQPDAVNTYLAPQPPKPQFSFFDWLQACCVEKPAGDQDYRLRQKEEVVLGHLQQEVATTFNAHSQALWWHDGVVIHGMAWPPILKVLDLDDTAGCAKSRAADSSDLSWNCIDSMQSTHRTLSPEYWYPFAAAVINVCFELSNWLLLDQRRANGKVQPDEVCNGLEYRRFAELTVEEPETFLLLATSAVVAMHEDGTQASSFALGKEWSSKKYTVMEFRKCVKTAIRRVQGLDGATFPLQVDATNTVREVVLRIATHLGPKAGRRLVLTSGGEVLVDSKPLLQQALGDEITYIAQHMDPGHAARSFLALCVEKPEIPTVGIEASMSTDELNAIDAIASLNFSAFFNQSLVGVTLPGSLRTLCFGEQFDQSLDGVLLPSSLQSLSFGAWFNQSLDGVLLPRSLETLAFGEHFDQSLEGLQLPCNLQTFTFGSRFNRSLAGVTLPSSLQTLTFGTCFNESLVGVTLPSGLQTLTFGENFNQSLAGVTLPSSLQTLTFGRTFDQSLEGVTLPSSLQSLKFGYCFSQSLDRVTLPDGLVTLTLGDRCTQMIDGVTWPSSLQTLTLGSFFNHSLTHVKLPSGLRTLTLGNYFNHSLDDVMLPSHLQSLTFGEGFDQSLSGVVLPTSLETLTFGNSFNKSLAGVTIPNCRTMHIGVHAKLILAGATLPRSLQVLTFDECFNECLEGVHLPSSLLHLTFGDVQDQKNCQSLALEGTTTDMTDASGGRVLVALETSVVCLNPIPFERQVKELLLQVRTSDALDLINATYSPEDPERQVQLGRFHALAGWALFRDLQFLKAFQHFMYSTEFSIEQVLLFWRRYLPDDWQPQTRPPLEGAPQRGTRPVQRDRQLRPEQRPGPSGAAEKMGGCQGKPAAAEAKAAPKKRDSSTIKKDIKDGGIGYAQFIIENTGKIADHYQMDKKKLGEGSYGSVSKATNISTKAIRAIAIMKMMDHPNIIKLYESFEDLRNIYLVMELCAGGELFDRIIESGHFSEERHERPGRCE